MKSKITKQASAEGFYQLLTWFLGWLIVVNCSLAITWRLITMTLTLNQFLFFFAGFIAGRYIQKTANQD